MFYYRICILSDGRENIKTESDSLVDCQPRPVQRGVKPKIISFKKIHYMYKKII